MGRSGPGVPCSRCRIDRFVLLPFPHPFSPTDDERNSHISSKGPLEGMAVVAMGAAPFSLIAGNGFLCRCSSVDTPVSVCVDREIKRTK